EACKFLGKVSNTDEDAARQLYEVTNLYYNYTGTKMSFCANAERCEGAYAALGDTMGWSWQVGDKSISEFPADADAVHPKPSKTILYSLGGSGWVFID
ncbi:hypothetical protein GCK32_022401, partial [Trichostrongylus colubriformis]